MAELRPLPHSPAGVSQQGAENCPPVADLIEYALGRSGPEVRRHVETHLQARSCAECHAWVNQARAAAEPVAPPEAALRRRAAAPTRRAASPWPGDLFRDLVERLQALEE